MVLIKKPLDDTWTYQKINTPFPHNAVKVIEQTNMYVALWYRHGKPVMGKAWNESGVVQCEFAVDQRCFGGSDVGGTIQLLTYEGTHVDKQFYYDWVTLTTWKNEISGHQVVRCGCSAPVYWNEFSVLGNYDINANKAYFAVGDKFVEVNRISYWYRKKHFCYISNITSGEESFRPIMRALHRPMNTPRGPQDQFVALWYRHGKPCMGRAWNHNGKIDASFVDGDREFTGETVGSLQLLVELSATAAGFDYCWLPYEQASRYIDKDFTPVHMNHVAPCVIVTEKLELLG
uniref:Cu_amine_oxid domain-containing protein n=1 Tax=Heterorhabditis bacteriophora TaxID=37862 RepID=A0A1I7XL10_HETBA